MSDDSIHLLRDVLDLLLADRGFVLVALVEARLAPDRNALAVLTAFDRAVDLALGVAAAARL